jgi:hypothetical protein
MSQMTLTTGTRRGWQLNRQKRKVGPANIKDRIFKDTGIKIDINLH